MSRDANFSHLRAGDVTETLIKATEQVSERPYTHALVLLYNLPADHRKEDCYLGVVGCDSMNLSTANWILDKAKLFLLGD